MVDIIIELCSSVLLFLSVILIAATFKVNNIKDNSVGATINILYGCLGFLVSLYILLN